MDFFNREKLKELQLALAIERTEKKMVEEKLKKLESMVHGERVRSGLCRKCKNGIWKGNEGGFLFGTINDYECCIDLKCNDFEQK